MTAETVLYIVIAGVSSMALALFMYGYRSKYPSSLAWTFGVLRFLTLFALFLLLINPSFKNTELRLEKPKLPVLLDNSSSVAYLENDSLVETLVQDLQRNEALNDRFEVVYYRFGNTLEPLDSLSFSEENTQITKALESLQETFRNQTAPTILLSDGNQTLGSDYEFISVRENQPVYPLILGDSLQSADLRIERLNSNRYAFLKNDFPVEAIITYNGEGQTTNSFTVSQGNAVVFQRSIAFSETENTATLTFTLPATRVGIQAYTAQIAPLPNEQNTVNNQKQFAVEVIDQATNILVVHTLVHPDLGALRKAIASNEQRSVTFASPSEALATLGEYQLVILYQPNRRFQEVYEALESSKQNTWTLTGAETDWNFLNRTQTQFQKETTYQDETVSGSFNPNYGTFTVEDLGFSDFPPLQTTFGELSVTIPHEVLLQQQVSGFDTGSAMLSTWDDNGRRGALWDGEGFWRWRAQSYLNSDSFQPFDTFMGQMIQYLASNNRRSRLEVSHESFYYSNQRIQLTAQYFDNTYQFDGQASLQISVTHEATNRVTTFPMLLTNNYYVVDLNSLAPGTYDYTVQVQGENIARSGRFTIIDFQVEQQFGNANVTKLQRLATHTGGVSFYASEYNRLIDNLLADKRYRTIQKSIEKTVPLIDWYYLLLIIALTLSAEWFIRKYNGLT
ncbi:vWA domain-containing protein [Altibacter sp. HG106]|uniref:vWA domain-containing protein n=1 Tax=Altibacter sp. HG106 TaxID=3023937 RepID=UPI002350AC2A|nr:vWA domain-containing protein [Altibacter sp. HG106]MDC7993599.1 VWA domain-containing protein [Altibacter sp. HG106]